MPSRSTRWSRENPDFERLLIEADWGALVRFARGGGNQYQMAYDLGISQSALARLESSVYPPTIRTLARVAASAGDMLEVSMIHKTFKETTRETVVFDGVRYQQARSDDRQIAMLQRRLDRLEENRAKR